MDAFPIVTPDGLDARQQALWDELTLGPRGFYTGGPDTPRLPDLYNAWMQFPAFGQMMLQLGDTVRQAPDMSGRHREIIVLTTSARLGALVEFDFHVPFALEQGLAQQQIDAIRAGAEPDFADATDRAVYDANLQLLQGASLTPEVRDRIVAAIGFPGLMQVIAAVTLYVATAWTTNIARVQLAEDFSADPARLSEFFAGKPARG